MNIGGAMNLQTGIFTVPVNGRYHFSFTACSSTNGQNYVLLRVNGGISFSDSHIGISETRTVFNNLPIVATLNLKKEDTVGTYLGAGSIVDNTNYHWTQFSGILLDEDLALS